MKKSLEEINSYLLGSNLAFILVRRNCNYIKFYESEKDSKEKEKKSSSFVNLDNSRLIQESITNEKSEFYILYKNINYGKKIFKGNLTSISKHGTNFQTGILPYYCTHYNIIHNDFDYSILDLQDLTYKLSYLYYNSNSPLSIPAPLQYSKKLAFMVGEILCEEDYDLIPSSRFKKQIISPYYI